MSKQRAWRVLTHFVVVAVIASLIALPGQNARAKATNAHSAAIKHGGTVVINWGPKGSWTRNFNPFSNSPTDGTLELIYEPLLMFNQMKGGAVVPWLASKYAWSHGNKTLTFYLRPNVKWNDGKPFTSADVKFSFMLAKTNPGITCGDCWTFLSGISTPNKTTVVFNFKKVNTTLLYYLGRFDPVPQHVFANLDPVKATNPSPVATGPFKVGSFSSQVFTLVRNKYYWQKGKPYVDTLKFPAYTGNDSAQLAAVNGELDWAGLLIPDAQSTYAAKNPNNHFWFQGVGAPVSLWLNNSQAPFNNVHVRKAIALAINRAQIAKIAEYGYTDAGNAGFVQPQFSKKWGDSSVLKMLPAGGSASKAKTELSKAKGVDTSGTYKIEVVQGWTDWNTAAQLIANQLKGVGINATVEPLAFGDYVSHLQQGNFGMAISWMAAGPTPFYLYHDDFTKAEIPPAGGPAGALANFSRWSSPQLDGLISSYQKTSNVKQQVSIVKQAQKIIANAMPIVPLFAGGDLWNEYSTRHFVGWPSPSSPYDIGSPYNHPSNLDVILHIHLK
jgi:peptide/nickel transport system substrate-binding protein